MRINDVDVKAYAIHRIHTVQRQMKFSILSLFWLMLYVALALVSLRHPAPSLELVVRLICGVSVAIALVLAFDRRSTPLFAFSVFAGLGAMNMEVSSNVVLSMLKTFELPTGSVEYSSMQSMLHYHFVMVCGMIGFAIGAVISTFPRRPAS